MACGVAAYSAAMFHLMTHAFFKALLFLAAGSVIHALGGEQDLRRMGGLRKQIPWTFWTMTAATLAIAGAPGFSGFFSKDEILAQAFSSPHGSWAFWAVGVFTAFLTSFYMFRLWFLTFFGESRAVEPAGAPAAPVSGAQLVGGGAQVKLVVPGAFVDEVMRELKKRQARIASVEPRDDGKVIDAWIATSRMIYLESELRDMSQGQVGVTVQYPQAKAPARHDEAHAHTGHAHESPPVMLAPLVILAVLSVVGGYIGVPAFLGGSNHFEHFLAPVMESGAMAASAAPEAAASEWMLTFAATGAGLLGFLMAWYVYHLRVGVAERIRQRLQGLYSTLEHKYYVDEIYDATFVQPLLALSTVLLWRGVDVNTIDGAVNGSADGTRAVSDVLRRMQSGNLRSYAGWIAAGAAAVVIYMVWTGVAR